MGALRAALILILVLYVLYLLYVAITTITAMHRGQVQQTDAIHTPRKPRKSINRYITDQIRVTPSSQGNRYIYQAPSKSIRLSDPVAYTPSLVRIAQLLEEPYVAPISVQQPDPQPQPQPHQQQWIHIIDPEQDTLTEEQIRDIEDRIGWSMRQNVHDTGVIQSCRAIVAKAVIHAVPSKSVNKNPVDLYDSVSAVISSSNCSEDIKKAARDALTHIIEVDSNTKYDSMTETDILRLVLDQAAETTDQKTYLTMNLADSNSVCAQGRASRLIDCLSLVQDTPIIPEALVKKQLLDELQSIHQKETDQTLIKTQFGTILRQKHERGIISSEQLQEFSVWPDSL